MEFVINAEKQERLFKATDAYHAHLDTCTQCERQPFSQCPEGARLLEAFVAVADEHVSRNPKEE